MTHPKPSNSSFRYLIAGLKPLANVKVWGSVGIMALVAFVFWQYYHHPEWVGSDQLPNEAIDEELEAEVGNSVDIGVTVQDLQQNRLNSQGLPVTPSPLENGFVDQPFNPSPEDIENNPNSPLLSPTADGENKDLNQPNSSIKFQPLMPNVKNLGSLFPPLTPSKNADQPVEIPETLQDKGKPTQDSALENALEDVFSQESPSINPSNPPQNSNRPSANTNRSPQSNYPTTATQGTNNPYPNQPYTQPNYPYNYSSPQPHSRPYGNGVAPAPVPAYPSSNQVPNTYGNTNPNPNYSSPANQNQPTYNYGMQPPQIDQYGRTQRN